MPSKVNPIQPNTFVNRMEIKPGAYIMIRGHKCYRCGHEWRPVDLNVTPRVCPKCKTPYWDRPVGAHKVKDPVKK